MLWCPGASASAARLVEDESTRASVSRAAVRCAGNRMPWPAVDCINCHHWVWHTHTGPQWPLPAPSSCDAVSHSAGTPVRGFARQPAQHRRTTAVQHALQQRHPARHHQRIAAPWLNTTPRRKRPCTQLQATGLASAAAAAAAAGCDSTPAGDNATAEPACRRPDNVQPMRHKPRPAATLQVLPALPLLLLLLLLAAPCSIISPAAALPVMAASTPQHAQHTHGAWLSQLDAISVNSRPLLEQVLRQGCGLASWG